MKKCISAIHIIIGLVIMFSGFFLPSPEIIMPPTEKLLALKFPMVDGGVAVSLTHNGMIILMLFFGVLYLWTFVNVLWPSFLGISVLLLSGIAPAGKIFTQILASPMTVTVFFILIIAAAIVYSDLATWIARYCMTRKFINGRPWVITGTILFTTYLVALLTATGSMFLMWPALYAIFKEVGYKKGEKYVSVMTVYIVMVVLLAFASEPFKGGPMYILLYLQNLAATDPSLIIPQFTYAQYFSFGLIISIITIFVFIFLLRFVFKADVTPLAQYRIPKDQANVPPMQPAQIFVLCSFLFYALWLLLPSIIGTENIIGAFMKSRQAAGVVLAVTLLTLVYVKGKPLVPLTAVLKNYPWLILILCVAVFLLVGYLTGKESNLVIFLECVFTKFMSGMNVYLFYICILGIAIVFTNFCNSAALGIMLTPILIGITNVANINGAPIMACFIYTVYIAACTPAGSVYSATLFGQTEWCDKNNLIKYSVLSSLVVFLIVCTIGIPLANLIF